MRLSKADKLAAAYQDKIIGWRIGGDTVDRIRDKLQEEDLPPEAVPGRSGMSLYVRKLDQAIERLLRCRIATATLGQKFDEAAEAKEARLNIELLGHVVMERLLDMGGKEAENLSAKEMHEFARLIDRLAHARRTDALTTIAVRKEARAESERAARAAPVAKDTPPADDEWSDERILRLQAKIAGVPYEHWIAGAGYRSVKQEDGTEKLERCADGAAPPQPSHSADGGEAESFVNGGEGLVAGEGEGGVAEPAGGGSG